MVCLYVQVCWLNPLVAYANEVSFYNQNNWIGLAYVETGFQVALCAFWMGLTGLSAVAVKKWRAVKKGLKGGKGKHGIGVEMN
jgi:hypothetical protein